MSRSLRVARCRNAHSREGAGFLARLSAAIDAAPGAATLLDPETAIDLEDELKRHVDIGLDAGSLTRETGLDFLEAQERWSHACSLMPSEEVYLQLSSFPEFPVKVALGKLTNALFSLHRLESDTICVSLSKISDGGFACDFFHDPEGSAKCEFDRWGQWQ